MLNHPGETLRVSWASCPQVSRLAVHPFLHPPRDARGTSVGASRGLTLAKGLVADSRLEQSKPQPILVTVFPCHLLTCLFRRPREPPDQNLRIFLRWKLTFCGFRGAMWEWSHCGMCHSDIMCPLDVDAAGPGPLRATPQAHSSVKFPSSH